MSDENGEEVDFNDPDVDFDGELAKKKALGPAPQYSMFIHYRTVFRTKLGDTSTGSNTSKPSRSSDELVSGPMAAEPTSSTTNSKHSHFEAVPNS